MIFRFKIHGQTFKATTKRQLRREMRRFGVSIKHFTTLKDGTYVLKSDLTSTSPIDHKAFNDWLGRIDGLLTGSDSIQDILPIEELEKMFAQHLTAEQAVMTALEAQE